MTETQKALYSNWVKLSRTNFDANSGKYSGIATFADGETVDFSFEAKDYVNKNGENCIGNIYIPGNEYYISIKTRQSQAGKIYYSGCINYDQKRFVNVNIIPTSDSVKEFTVSFSKPAGAIDPEVRAENEGLPF